MPSAIENLIASSNTSRSMVDLAFSWIFDNPEITCVLSGMNSMEMLEENINITNNHLENPLNDDEKELINSMEDIFLDLNEINCTGCNYCMPCPQQINIPDIFKLYNDKNLFPENSSYGIHHNFILYSGNILGVTGDAHDASLCVDCGLCKSKCPQQLDIPHLIRNVDNTFHGKYIRPFIPFVKRLMNIFL
jgi:predicted aldo/keto reductase-like oxidoreductase